jgi:hypothetical protein
VHKRTFNEAHSDQGSEYLRIRAGQGTFVYLLHDITPSRVIEELTPQVWVKSDRVGIRLMARVVLPRSRKADGSPQTALLPGDIYQNVGAWQLLRVDEILKQLDRQVWILRRQFGPDVDSREAYIDLLVLNAYGGPGVTNLWIDDLELSGHAAVDAPVRFAGAHATGESPPPIRPTVNPSLDGHVDEEVRLQGSVLTVSGRPLMPLGIEHRGEAFSHLQALGFNTILLPGTPTATQLAEAKQLGLWLVAPPPVIDTQSAESYEHVLAWSLGDGLTRRDVSATRQFAAQLRSLPAAAQRPLVAGIVDDCAGLEGSVDILMPSRALVDTASLTEYWRWLRRCALRQRPGTPFWAALDTEIPLELERQVNAIGGRHGVPAARETSSLRLMAVDAVAAGARGLCFRSRSRLDSPDAATELRAATLKWINQELLRVEPWVAGGKYLEEITVNDSRTRAHVLETERARLLVVTRDLRDLPVAECPLHPPPPSFFVHGIPITDQAFRLGSAGLHSLRGTRGNGVQISLEASEATALILLTQDPLAINHVRRRLADTRGDMVAVQQEVAELLLHETETIDRQLAALGQTIARTEPLFAEATTRIESARRLMKTGDAENAGDAARQAIEVLQRIRRMHWERATRSFPSPEASPLVSSFRTLPLHWEMVARMQTVTWGNNDLAAGDFEDLDHMRSNGWSQTRSGNPNIQKAVELSLHAPRSGRSCLQMQAWADDDESDRRLEQWPITIRSGPVPVRQGELVRIAGWIRVPRRIRNHDDGVMIFDSLGGPQLALKIPRTDGWQEFSIYRAATHDGTLSVTIALTGLGEAWLDKVAVFRAH